MEKDINNPENNKYTKNKPYGTEDIMTKQEVYTDLEPKKGDGIGSKKTVIEQYSIDSARTFAYRKEPLSEKTTDLLHCAIGASTEANELLDAFKKHMFYGKPLDIVNIGEEIADQLWYLTNLARLLNLNIEELLNKNIEKLRVRFPDKFSEEKAINRDVNAERKKLE